MTRDPFKVRHPFFLPKVRRLVTVLLCFGWGVAELILGNPIWFAVFIAIGGYLTYHFFVVFDPKDYRAEDSDDEG